jgi:hypothetical protein
MEGSSAMSRTHDVTISAFDLDRLERELTTVTEQRDSLAEALERVLEYQGRFDEEDPESIAAEALAAVKGKDS